VAIVPSVLEGANITQGTARLRPGPEIISSYLAHWLSSGAAQRWLTGRMRGIDMPGLNLRDVRQLPVPVPPLDVQQEISTRLDDIVSRAGDLRASCDRLTEALPDLETALVESFAYGMSAAAISGRMPVETQVTLSRELLESLKDQGRRPKATSTSTGSEARERPPSGGKTEARVQPVRTGLQVTNSNDVIQALRALGGTASPEDLYMSMKLSEAAVDSFYDVLRQLVRERSLKEVRPNTSDVELKLVAKE
jgi:type I restriction enzyme, S subunit